MLEMDYLLAMEAELLAEQLAECEVISWDDIFPDDDALGEAALAA